MDVHVEIMNRAFAALEILPEEIAFQILAKLDQLRRFPEMGSPLGARFPKLKAFRQILYRSSIRIIYEFDKIDNTIYVLAIQDCRQKLPLPRDLKRDV